LAFIPLAAYSDTTCVEVQATVGLTCDLTALIVVLVIVDFAVVEVLVVVDDGLFWLKVFWHLNDDDFNLFNDCNGGWLSGRLIDLFNLFVGTLRVVSKL